MKAIFARILLASFGLKDVCLTGCESDLPPSPERANPQNKIERDISSHGTVVNPDNSTLTRDNPNGGN